MDHGHERSGEPPSTRQTGVFPDVLVSTEWLAAHLEEPSLRIVDIRGYVRTTDLGGGRQQADYLAARDEYDAGHIPGAVYIDWTVDIVDPDVPVKAQLAPAARFAVAMASRGVGNNTDVAIVDHTGGHFATRLWWALQCYGHERVAVVDGGYQKWLAEGRPVSTTAPQFEPSTFVTRVRPEFRIEADELLTSLGSSDQLVVDARDAGQYRGEVVRGTRGGHVPSAVNIAAKSLVNDDGTWKPLAEQRRLLAAGGVRSDRRVVAYCNGGVTATAVLFALYRTGHQQFANYDGSWNEWGEREDLPVEVGDGTSASERGQSKAK